MAIELIQSKTGAIIDGTAARKVDLSKGSTNSEVSRQWWNRPEDERYTSLEELQAAVSARRERSFDETISLADLQFAPDGRDVVIEHKDGLSLGFTNWSMRQLCSSIGAPMAFLAKLPAPLVAANLQAAAIISDDSGMQYVERLGDGIGQVRAFTSASYGRIHDADVVSQVSKIAGNGGWKVPGTMKFGSGVYDPKTPVTKDTTTLFASDRDVFAFLVDDTNPIEVGTDRHGDPDLMFRGFIVSNSEVGAGRFRLATMYLRAVCQNRILWGVENFNEVSIRHNSRASDRFYDEIMPALDAYAGVDPASVVKGVTAAKQLTVAKDNETEEQIGFLVDMGFSRKVAAEVIVSAEECEGHKPSTAWDFAQGLTARAQSAAHQDERFEMEQAAGKILEKAVA